MKKWNKIRHLLQLKFFLNDKSITHITDHGLCGVITQYTYVAFPRSTPVQHSQDLLLSMGGLFGKNQNIKEKRIQLNR